MNPVPAPYCCLDSSGVFANGGDSQHCCSVQGGVPELFNIDKCSNPFVDMSGDIYTDPNPCQQPQPIVPYCCCNSQQCISGDGQSCCTHPLHSNIMVSWPYAGWCEGVSANSNIMIDLFYNNSCNNTLAKHYTELYKKKKTMQTNKDRKKSKKKPWK